MRILGTCLALTNCEELSHKDKLLKNATEAIANATAIMEKLKAEGSTLAVVLRYEITLMGNLVKEIATSTKETTRVQELEGRLQMFIKQITDQLKEIEEMRRIAGV